MIIVMQKYASQAAIDAVIVLIKERGLREHVSYGIERTIIGVVGDERTFAVSEFETLPQVERAMRVVHAWRMISREAKEEDSRIKVRGVSFGEKAALKIAACTQVGDLSGGDAVFLDPFFVAHNPYELSNSLNVQEQLSQNLLLAHKQNKPVLVRMRDVRQLEHILSAGADVLYLGGELMHNQILQAEVGQLNMPIVLCKDKHHGVHDWLLAAERIALGGNHHIIFCEAGALSLDPQFAARLDVEAIAAVRTLSHLPIIANVSRLGNKYVSTQLLARVALGAGACGTIQRCAPSCLGEI